VSKLRSLAGPMAIVAIAVVAWSCETHRTALAPGPAGRCFISSSFSALTFKNDGGGRITIRRRPDKNPPKPHVRDVGAHVIASGQTDESGRAWRRRAPKSGSTTGPEMQSTDIRSSPRHGGDLRGTSDRPPTQ